jgi:hypothetical protein
MTSPDPGDGLLSRRFSAYRRELDDQIRAPGVSAVYRTIHRRQRTRMVAVSVAAVITIVLLIGQFALARQESRPPADRPMPAPSVVEPSVDPAGSASPSPSASPPASSSSAQRPGGTTAPPRSSSPPAGPQVAMPPQRTFPVVDGSELHVVGPPGPVTLRPDGGVYRGVIYVDVYNSGRQTHTWVSVYVTEPAGVRIDSSRGNVGFGSCVGASPPETWACSGSSIPAEGGYRRYPVAVQVDLAPTPTERRVDGFALRFGAAKGDGTDQTDATPADNHVAVPIVLAAS